MTTSDRRKARRYVIGAGAQARVLQEVVVERVETGRAVVIAVEAAAPDDAIVVDLHSRDGRMSTCDARVISSTPVMGGSGMRFRLELAVENPPTNDHDSSPS